MTQIPKEKNECPNGCGNMKLVTSVLCAKCYRKAPNSGGRPKMATAWDESMGNDFLRRGLRNVSD